MKEIEIKTDRFMIGYGPDGCITFRFHYQGELRNSLPDRIYTLTPEETLIVTYFIEMIHKVRRGVQP